MSNVTAIEQNAIQDRNVGYFTMIPNIIFKLGLSAQAESAYCRVKCHAGADLKALPRHTRRIAKLIGLSKSGWDRALQELRLAGLIRVEGEKIILTDVMLVNAKHFSGKITIEKAIEQIKALGDTQAKQLRLKSQPVPNLGQKACPESGTKAVPNSGHMINNMKNNNMRSLSSSPVPNMSSAEKTQDDESKALTQVVFWFEELSKGSAWNWNRDGKAYDQVKHLAPGFILMGICYSVSKCPRHKLSTFAYCLPAIRDYAEQLIVNADDALQLALRERKKVLKMAKLGKWTVPEMSEEEYKSVMRESRAGD